MTRPAKDGRTAGPWESHRAATTDNTGGTDYAIVDANGKIIAETFEHVGRFPSGAFDTRPASANAAFIVEACNAHDTLTAQNRALREALVECSDFLGTLLANNPNEAGENVLERAYDALRAGDEKDGQ